ncbi:MAG: hypothetical protein SchgKO_25640 [Schleiferiaceae bacterium]
MHPNLHPLTLTLKILFSLTLLACSTTPPSDETSQVVEKERIETLAERDVSHFKIVEKLNFNSHVLEAFVFAGEGDTNWFVPVFRDVNKEEAKALTTQSTIHEGDEVAGELFTYRTREVTYKVLRVSKNESYVSKPDWNFNVAGRDLPSGRWSSDGHFEIESTAHISTDVLDEQKMVMFFFGEIEKIGPNGPVQQNEIVGTFNRPLAPHETTDLLPTYLDLESNRLFFAQPGLYAQLPDLEAVLWEE